MLFIILFFSIFIVPYFIYRKFLVKILRNYENRLQNFLEKKSFSEEFLESFFFYSKKYNFKDLYISFKFSLLSLTFFFFLFTTKMFFTEMINLPNYKIFVSITLFIIPYLILLFFVSTICINSFKKKFIYIDEIFDIFLISCITIVLCLFLEEYILFIGKMALLVFKQGEKIETVEVTVSKSNADKFVSTPIENKPTFLGEIGKYIGWR